VLTRSTRRVQRQSQCSGKRRRWRVIAGGHPRSVSPFSEDMGKRHAIVARVGGKAISCPLRYQDVAYSLTTANEAVALGFLGMRVVPLRSPSR